MELTTYYQLKKWDPQDRVLRTEFNENSDKTDAGLAAAKTAADSAAEAAEAAMGAAQQAQEAAAQQAAAVAALQTAVAACGNCRLETGTYVGSGGEGGLEPNSLTFSGTPYFVVIGSVENSLIILAARSSPYGVLLNGISDNIYLTWQGKTLKWFSNYSAGYQLNEAGKTYFYTAFTQP